MVLGEIGWEGVDWINLTQDRNQWRALVNTVIIIVSIRQEKFLDRLSDY
jgi:hypothetical protein